MKKVYICHPFSEDPVFNKQRTEEICKDIIRNEEGVLPISPIHKFNFVEEETPEIREAIMKDCLGEIRKLADEGGNEIRVYLYDSKMSTGQGREHVVALEEPIDVIYINGDLL